MKHSLLTTIKENPTWGDVKSFINTLPEDVLKYPVLFMGEEIGGKIRCISVASDEGINPSGEGIEPRKLYSKSKDKADRIIASEEPTLIPMGMPIIEVN